MIIIISSGCCHYGKGYFDIPERPETVKLNYIWVDDNACLDFENRKKDRKNIISNEAYIDMLKITIDGCNEVIK